MTKEEVLAADMMRLVVSVRQMCGCVQCQGGYDLGKATLAMGAESSRPMSCLAPALAHAMVPYVLQDSRTAVKEKPDYPTTETQVHTALRAASSKCMSTHCSNSKGIDAGVTEGPYAGALYCEECDELFGWKRKQEGSEHED